MKLTHVSLGVLLAALTGLGACSKKGEEKKDNGGEQETDDGGTDPNPSPCLRLLDDGDGDVEVVDADADGGEDDEATDAESTDAEADDGGNADTEIDPSGVGTTTTNADCGGGGGTEGGGSGATGPGGPSDPVPISGKTLDECVAEGKAWKPVNGGKAEAQCGDALVNWCCTQTEILKRFPSYAAALEAKYTEVTTTGEKWKLYHCSQVPGKTTFHFAIGNSTGAHYKTVFAPADAQSGDPKDDSCVDVTMADLNFKKAGATDEDDEADDEEEDTDEPLAAAATIPATVGELAGADDKLEIRDWLGAASFKSGTWARHTTTQTLTEHGKGRSHWNKTLQDSKAVDPFVKHAKDSIAVLELRDNNGSAGNIKGYLIMAKVAANPGKNSWLFYKVIDNVGSDWESKEPEIHEVANATCAGCHIKTENEAKDGILGTKP